MTYVLGINSIYHESSACLLHDGAIVATAEEERFNRRKHGKEARADNADELPTAAISFCLELAGIEPADVDHVALPCDPADLEATRRAGLPLPWADPVDAATFVRSVANIPDRLRRDGFGGTTHWVAHHQAHAASAYYVTGHREAAVLVVDALGDDTYSTRSFHGVGQRLDVVRSIRYPASIGYLWELVSVFLGFGVYGDAERYASAFDRLAWTTSDGFDMRHDALHFDRIMYYPPSADVGGMVDVLGIGPRAAGSPILDEHHDVAAALQAKTDELVGHLARTLREDTGADALCLAGGVALNCVTNTRVFHDGPYRELYVQPAAHDGGLALGAAMQVWNDALDGARAPSMQHAYWGPSFDDAAIEVELARRGLVGHRVPDLSAAVAERLVQKHVVGLFQGPMELGPRALGNRSIIADPRRAEMREVLNDKVKHREYFRPLAPSVLAEHAHDWFEIDRATPANEYMLMAYRARAERRDRIGAVLHVDDTCRVQAVRRDTNPQFHDIISAFHSMTGVPMVLNTSFNNQEPIICTPADAVQTFTSTRIDDLVIGSFIVSKDR